MQKTYLSVWQSMRNFFNHQQRTFLSFFKFGYKRSCFDTSARRNENSSESFAVYAILSRLVSRTSNISTQAKSFLGSCTFSRKLRSCKRGDKWNVVKLKPKNHLETITTEADCQMRLTLFKQDIWYQWKTRENPRIKQLTFGLAYDWLRKGAKFLTNHKTQSQYSRNTFLQCHLRGWPVH